MLSFIQFKAISESVHDTTVKGWMSPGGDAHLFHGEHYLDHHPTIAKKMKPYVNSLLHRLTHDEDGETDPTETITRAQKLGYTRFSKNGDSHMIHYDKDSKQGRQSALHALKHLNPTEPTRIVVRNRPFGYGKIPGQRMRGDTHDAVFTKASDAARHILKETKDLVTTPKALNPEVLAPEKKSDLILHSALSRHGYKKVKTSFKDDTAYRTYHHPRDTRFTVHTKSPMNQPEHYEIHDHLRHSIKGGSGYDKLDADLSKHHGWESDPDRRT